MKLNLLVKMATILCLSTAILAQLADQLEIAQKDAASLEFANPNDGLEPGLELGIRDRYLRYCRWRKGLTWGFISHDCKLGTDFVGCWGSPASSFDVGQCNPYHGDTVCTAVRPILCINKLNLRRPAYDIECSPHAMQKEFYCGWSGALLALSKPIQGCRLINSDFADRWCAETVGCGYVMASHGDGYFIDGMNSANFNDCTWDWSKAHSGGWSFRGYSNLRNSNTRWWTKINDQFGNCWNSL